MEIDADERGGLGYLVNGRDFLSLVAFRLERREDDQGRGATVGEMTLKGPGCCPEQQEGPLTILAHQGYSLHLTVTDHLGEGRYAFRIRRTEASAS